jgi:hypothetical protein
VPNLKRIGLLPEVWTRDVTAANKYDWEVLVREIPKRVPSQFKVEAIFLTVPDDHIADVSRRLSPILKWDIPVIHNSGATAVTTINEYFEKRAALWPIRSLKIGEPTLSWEDLPLAYYCEDLAFEKTLRRWASKLSKLTYQLDDEQRARLHLAAVFSNNFTTWLCQIAYEICGDSGVPFEALVPIIKDTFSKIDANKPALRQTGAAIREDLKTMQRHEELLKDNPEYLELYQRMSELIMSKRKKE